jgi:hypothetical protein
VPKHSDRTHGTLMTPDEAAAFLKVTPRQLKRAVVERRIPVIAQPFGFRITRFYREDLIDGLDAYRRGTVEDEVARDRVARVGVRRKGGSK